MNNNSNSQYANKSNAELLAIINGLQAEVDAKKNRKLTFHISENKGGLMIKTGGRFPITMYLGVFDRLRAQWDELCAFVDKYRAHFAVKDKEWDAKVSLAGLPESVIARKKEEKETPAA